MSTKNQPVLKERKHPLLWQSYLWWYELMELRKRHLLRISSAERGVSNFDAGFEQLWIDTMNLDALVHPKNKAQREVSVQQVMINHGEAVGPIWGWLLSQRGIGESLAAQLLAQIDDIGNFDTVAKLWRFCGYGIYKYWVDEKGKVKAPVEGWRWVGKKEDAKKVLTVILPADQWNGREDVTYKEPGPSWQLVSHRDVNIRDSGYHSPYNRLLKSVCYNIADQFIRQQSPPWIDIYYSEKEYQRTNHPEPVKENGKTKFSDAHIHNRAWRKMIKTFLRELWIEWRKSEGLPV